MNNITLFTDASWDPKRQIGGWAAWANMDAWEEPKRASGIIMENLISANDAELYSIYRGLRWICQVGNCRSHVVLIRSDSSRSLRLLLQCCEAKQSMAEFSLDVSGKRQLKLSPEDQRTIDWINETRTTNNLLLSVRHVYGHTGHNINSIVDRMAGQRMRTQRKH